MQYLVGLEGSKVEKEEAQLEKERSCIPVPFSFPPSPLPSPPFLSLHPASPHTVIETAEPGDRGAKSMKPGAKNNCLSLVVLGICHTDRGQTHTSRV